MSTRHQTEKDRKRAEQEKLQIILNRLLKEEENKYCADCEAKGPRWASWNLGVFLCIRCAGIHRNLGVHLSKVKSVNLDTWTVEQVQHMRVIGNSVGKAVYEATLPEHFRRPQTDSALEAFIRGKYEHKRYMMKDYVPVKIDARDLLNSDEFLKPTLNTTAASTGKDGSGGKKTKTATTLSLDPKSASAGGKKADSSGKERVRRKSSNAQQPPDGKHADGQQKTGGVSSAINDLVDLDIGSGGGPTIWGATTPNAVTNQAESAFDDLLGLNVSSTVQSHPGPADPNQVQQDATRNGQSDLGQDLLIGPSGGTESTDLGTNNNSTIGVKKTKNDILALYGSGGGVSNSQPSMMTGMGFNMPQTPQQVPFNVLQGQQMMNFGVPPTPTNSWPMNENAAPAYGNVQPVLCDPLQQTPTGYVATPFGYVPVASQAQQNVAPFSQANFPATNNSSSNLHLQAVQQQLASLQLQRAQTQPHPQQDTLATGLWH